ncbi:MAG: hypothetical protein HY673_26320 [Chloroflexi bacterium]|nr:hypothetical protein [Chloroflexota bacterium]
MAKTKVTERTIASEDVEIDLEMLREELVIVLQSINQLEEHRDIMVNTGARDALNRLISNQKESYTILTDLIKKLDPDLK